MSFWVGCGVKGDAKLGQNSGLEITALRYCIALLHFGIVVLRRAGRTGPRKEAMTTTTMTAQDAKAYLKDLAARTLADLRISTQMDATLSGCDTAQAASRLIGLRAFLIGGVDADRTGLAAECERFASQSTVSDEYKAAQKAVMPIWDKEISSYTGVIFNGRWVARYVQAQKRGLSA